MTYKEDVARQRPLEDTFIRIGSNKFMDRALVIHDWQVHRLLVAYQIQLSSHRDNKWLYHVKSASLRLHSMEWTRPYRCRGRWIKHRFQVHDHPFHQVTSQSPSLELYFHHTHVLQWSAWLRQDRQFYRAWISATYLYRVQHSRS